MMDAAGRRLTSVNRLPQRCQRQPRVDAPRNRVANHPARPGVEDHCDIDEADRDRHLGQVSDPQLVGSGGNEAFRQVGKDRAFMIALGRAHEPTQRSHLEPTRALLSKFLPIGLLPETQGNKFGSHRSGLPVARGLKTNQRSSLSMLSTFAMASSANAGSPGSWPHNRSSTLTGSRKWRGCIGYRSRAFSSSSVMQMAK